MANIYYLYKDGFIARTQHFIGKGPGSKTPKSKWRFTEQPDGSILRTDAKAKKLKTQTKKTTIEIPGSTMKLVEKKMKNGNYTCKIEGTDILHKIDGPAKISNNGKSKEWRLFGVEHRIGGPAIITAAGTDFQHEEWYVNGLLHRLDGPAETYGNGVGCKSYYILGEYYTKAKFDKIVKNKELVKQIEAFVNGKVASSNDVVVSKNDKAKSESGSTSVIPMLAAASMLAGAGFVWAQKKSVSKKPVQQQASVSV